MSNNLEIVMDIDTLEIFEVIEVEQVSVSEDTTNHPKENQTATAYEQFDRILINGTFYYKPSSILWEIVNAETCHTLAAKTKYGSYPYIQRARDGTWGKIKQLTEDEALWLTLELNPELMCYV